jgi:hypothetical protein
MSAQHIFDTAPLGALIRFSDGTPKPPARFTKKLAAWENNNAVGRLTAKSGASQMGNHMMPATFALHMGDYAWAFDRCGPCRIMTQAPGLVLVPLAARGVAASVRTSR